MIKIAERDERAFEIDLDRYARFIFFVFVLVDLFLCFCFPFFFFLNSFTDRPWCKPGADITDFFNYGFDEISWRAYVQQQVRTRRSVCVFSFDFSLPDFLNLSLSYCEHKEIEKKRKMIG